MSALNAPGMPETPHRSQTGDWVYRRRHRAQLLEHCWKGPCLVLLTTPTVLRVGGIAAWVHTSHVKPADALLPRDPHWMVQKRDNLPKLKITGP